MTRYFRNVCQSLPWISTSSSSIETTSPKPSWKSTSEYAETIKYYKVGTYTNDHKCMSSGFQISSYHEFEATQIKYQVWCAASEAWSLCGIRLHPLLTQASTQNSTRLTGKLWHARGTMTLLPLSAPAPFEVASDTSATQMWRGTRRGNHTDLSRNLFCLGLQTNQLACDMWVISTEKKTSGSPVDYEKK